MSESTASYPFPVMGEGRLDYASGCSYETSDWSIESDRVELTHQVKGESLVSQLIRENKAGFGCVAVIPSTMYRLISPCEEIGLSVKHVFEIEKKNRSIQIIKFLPIIVYKGEREEFIADSSMGVDEIWQGQKFVLQKGAIIARDLWRQINPKASHLLKVKENKELRKGAIEVDIAHSDGGYFRVSMSSDLYDNFKKAETQGKELKSHRDSILTHALSVGLAETTKKYFHDDDLGSLENFQALKQTLEKHNEQSWDEEDFDPCKAACAYLPHCFDVVSKIEEE